MTRISLLSFSSQLVLNALGIYCEAEADVRKCSVKRVLLNILKKFIKKITVQVSLFYHNVGGLLEKSVLPWTLRDFLEHLFCITCERLLLVLVRIGLVWRAANLLIFWIIVCKSVFQILKYSFQLILHWCTPNQRTNLKVGVSPFFKKKFICFDETALKMVKNHFYFFLKALFVLKTFQLLSWNFGHAEEKD